MNLPTIVIIGNKGNELEKFFKENGISSAHVKDINELKKKLLEEDIALLLVEEIPQLSLLNDLIVARSPFTKVVIFGNSSKTSSFYTEYEYIKWPNKKKDLILKYVKLEILKYIFLKEKFSSIEKIVFSKKNILKCNRKVKDFFSLLEILRSFKNELSECDDLKEAIIISEKYIKKIFKYDFFALIIDANNKKFDIHGFSNSSEVELLKGFLRYLILSFRVLSNLQVQQLAKVYINQRKISIDEIIWPESISSSSINISSNIASCILFPMISGKENIGCIGIGSKKENVFNVDDLKIISFIGYELAHVFANIKLILHIKDISIKDALTGLYNRRYFDEILQHEYLRAKRYNLPLSLIMVDIDYFKSVNDTFGHLTGDKVLQELAKLIKNSVRQVDVVARFGGEEFAIILLNTSLEKASNMAERLRRIIEKHTILINGNKINITISAGISGIRKDTLSERDIVEEADKALFKAKTSGRNKVYVYIGKGAIREVRSEGLRERRRFKRIPTNLWMNYIPLLLNNEKNKVKAILKNISEEGISFESSQEIKKDALLWVDFDIPLDKDVKHNVKAIAQVIWNKKEKDKNIVGARLIILEQYVREVIKKYIIKSNF